ncbi:MAG: alpha/beta hydrolase, partial [Bdellovibrionales bacterium]|nr:alpha/beta hydrolase [Bdellovibrionales bacterium]
KIILVGHSYGTAVAAKMATLPYIKYQSVFLFSAIADPEEVKNDKPTKITKFFDPFSASFIGQSLIPNNILVCQKEISSFDKNLTSLLSDWNKIAAKVVVVNGENDDRAKVSNGPFIKSKIGGNTTEVKVIKGAGHSLINDNTFDVVNLLLKEL